MRRIFSLVAALFVLPILPARALAAGSLYPKILTDSKPLLVAFDARDGKQVWRMRSDNSGQLRVFAARSDRLFAEVRRCMHLDRRARAGDSNLVAFDAGTGREAWRRADVVATGKPVAGNGETLLNPSWWRVNADAITSSSSVIPLTSKPKDLLLALDATTGHPRWRASLHGLETAATTRNLVVMSSAYGAPAKVRAVGATTGSVKWWGRAPWSGGSRSVTLGLAG